MACVNPNPNHHVFLYISMFVHNILNHDRTMHIQSIHIGMINNTVRMESMIYYVLALIEGEGVRRRSQSCSRHCAAVARFDGSRLSMGNRNELNDSASISSILYFSTNTSLRGQYSRFRIFRSSPFRRKNCFEYLLP